VYQKRRTGSAGSNSAAPVLQFQVCLAKERALRKSPSAITGPRRPEVATASGSFWLIHLPTVNPPRRRASNQVVAIDKVLSWRRFPIFLLAGLQFSFAFILRMRK
jgi:hypothetical protein